MIETEGLKFAYPGSQAVLRGIDIKINDGEFVAIMGENGAGKTTLVKTFNGLLRPTAGRVKVDGVDTHDSSVARLSKDVGLVFQNPDHQLFSETVWEELAFSLRNFGYKEDTIDRRVASILETLDLTRYTQSSPFVLSGGERKRVALAAVLVWNPKHIILDEPTIGQDYQQKDRLRNFIIQLNAQGKTVIVITHDVEFVAECKPRIILLSRGLVIGDRPAEDILTDGALLDRASLTRPQIGALMHQLKDCGLPERTIDVYAAEQAILHALGRKE
ncbi:MAG: ABC transporter ATP-binding protein [Candidatus Bathyarchaeia archaeon]|jgi:energy-coupling factor transport system ATP-binding protein